MTKKEILARVDHTLLKQTACWEQIRKICDEGMEYHTASVCIPPCFVARAAKAARTEKKGGPAHSRTPGLPFRLL